MTFVLATCRDPQNGSYTSPGFAQHDNKKDEGVRLAVSYLETTDHSNFHNYPHSLLIHVELPHFLVRILKVSVPAFTIPAERENAIVARI